MATGEIWSAEDCRDISEIDRMLLLFPEVIVVSRVGVICKDLLFPSSNEDLQNSIAFNTVGEELELLLDIIEVLLDIDLTLSVSVVEGV